jgi:hypothetical protein
MNLTKNGGDLRYSGWLSDDFSTGGTRRVTLIANHDRIVYDKLNISVI